MRKEVLAGRSQLGFWVEGLALPSDRDTCASGEVQFLGHLATGADVIRNSEADDLWHPSLVPVPVDLEPFGVPLVKIIGCDEVEAHTVCVGADTRDDGGQETGLRVSSGKDLVGGDFELVT